MCLSLWRLQGLLPTQYISFTYTLYIDLTLHSVLRTVSIFFAVVSCGPLVAPSNGRVDTSDGTLFGDTATYSCDAGYPISGPSKRTCKANGQWSGTMPTCESEWSTSTSTALQWFVKLTEQPPFSPSLLPLQLLTVAPQHFILMGPSLWLVEQPHIIAWPCMTAEQDSSW